MTIPLPVFHIPLEKILTLHMATSQLVQKLYMDRLERILKSTGCNTPSRPSGMPWSFSNSLYVEANKPPLDLTYTAVHFEIKSKYR